MSAYGASGYGSRPVFFMGACSSAAQTQMYSALKQKGWNSYVGFSETIYTKDNARIARYFFYYGTRHFRHASVWDAYIEAKDYALANPAQFGMRSGQHTR